MRPLYHDRTEETFTSHTEEVSHTLPLNFTHVPILTYWSILTPA